MEKRTRTRRESSTAGVSPVEVHADKEFIDALLARIDSWTYITETLIPFTKEIQKIENTTARAYAKLGTGLELKGNETTGLNLGLKSLKTYTSNEGVYHADYSKYIEEQTLEGLAKLAKDVAKKSKALKKKLAQASLQKVREPAMQAIAAHIRACELAEVQQQAQPATKSPDIPAQMLDPWWTELKLRATINQVVVQENNYKEQMVGLFKEVEETDKYLTKTIKEVYSKLAKWRIRQLGAMQEDIRDVESKMDQVDESAEWSTFLQEKGMVTLRPWKEKVGAEDFKYPYKNHMGEILKEGVLFRQGKIFSSNWKKAYCVFTVGCFLHCFDSSDSFNLSRKQGLAEPLFTIDFKESAVAIPSDAALQSSAFEVKNNGKKAMMMKAPNEEDLVDWVFIIKQTVGAQSASTATTPTSTTTTTISYSSQDDNDGISESVEVTFNESPRQTIPPLQQPQQQPQQPQQPQQDVQEIEQQSPFVHWTGQ